MKANIHPNWHHDCKVTCSCGNIFNIGSTFTELEVDICNACHPFFTGEMKFVDRQGRVDRFKQKVEKAKKTQQKHKKAKGAQEDSKSYREILRDQQSVLRSQTKEAKAAEEKGAQKATLAFKKDN